MKDPGLSVGTNFDAKSLPAASLGFLICRVGTEPKWLGPPQPRLLRSFEPQFLPLRRGSDSSQVASLALRDQEGEGGRRRVDSSREAGPAGAEGAARARGSCLPGSSPAPPRGTRRQLWDGVCDGAVARPGAGAGGRVPPGATRTRAASWRAWGARCAWAPLLPRAPAARARARAAPSPGLPGAGSSWQTTPPR